MVNWENLKDEYLATRKAKGIRATTDYDTSRRLSNLLRTLSGKPTPLAGREAMINTQNSIGQKQESEEQKGKNLFRMLLLFLLTGSTNMFLIMIGNH